MVGTWQVENLAERMAKWLKVGGFIFFRESCFHQSGDCKRKNNPTHYREPRFYTKVFKELHLDDRSGNSFELSLIGCKCIGAYVRNKKNQNQICWILQKVNSHEDKGFQRFLDNVQYKCNGILRYERVFGEGFVSTGGIDTTKEFVAKLELTPGQKVLDVGCGIGGGDFYMAENFDVEVFGIDLSINMVSFALERAIGRKCLVEFEVADCTKKAYPNNTFDVIYSRDTILHIKVIYLFLNSYFSVRLFSELYRNVSAFVAQPYLSYIDFVGLLSYVGKNHETFYNMLVHIVRVNCHPYINTGCAIVLRFNFRLLCYNSKLLLTWIHSLRFF
uniref:phosphoethanolamine N-methyltransferase n=1 Tax=Nelumbo nucifera TaxID=4432 RepID=A0A822YX24_NELNU|nr:TPA_asm: hypothetical protein HUJ06_006345 [Nelumbo nucifera]